MHMAGASEGERGVVVGRMEVEEDDEEKEEEEKDEEEEKVDKRTRWRHRS